MKKILSLLLVLVMCFTLFACVSTPSPTDVADSYLKAIKTSDTEQMSKLYAGDISDIDFMAACKDITESNEELGKAFVSKFTSFEYKTSNEVIKDDKATVDVTIKTYKLGDAFSSAISEYVKEGLGLALSGASDEEMNKLMTDKFKKAFDEATFDYEKTVKLNLSKTDDGWVVDAYDDDSELFNALTGGIVDAGKEMANAFGLDEEADN